MLDECLSLPRGARSGDQVRASALAPSRFGLASTRPAVPASASPAVPAPARPAAPYPARPTAPDPARPAVPASARPTAPVTTRPAAPVPTPSPALSFVLSLASLSALLLFLAGCGGRQEGALRGHVTIDGSSTVYPVAEAVAEEFQREFPRVLVTADRSGTGGGLAKFCRGETDVSNASRRINEQEASLCAVNDIRYLELPLALDGISVVVNPAAGFVECLSVAELRRIWRPGSNVRTWRDVRPEFPAVRLRLYGPGTDSGTFDFFTEAIVGQAGASRTDFQASEDDNVLVQGLIGDPYSLGYFGYSYMAENRGRLRVLAVDGGEGCVSPTPESIRDGRYRPLRRQLFLYVKRSSLERPGVQAFMAYFMDHASGLIPSAGLLALPARAYAENLEVMAEVIGHPLVEPSVTGEGR